MYFENHFATQVKRVNCIFEKTLNSQGTILLSSNKKNDKVNEQ